MLGLAGQFHLVHGVFLTEEPAALSAVDSLLAASQGHLRARNRSFAGGIRTGISIAQALPVRAGDFLLRVSADGGWLTCGMSGDGAAGGVGDWGRRGRGRGGIIRLEDIEALELLVEDGEGLELLGLVHLLLEPGLDLVLLLDDEVLVGVVEMSGGD